ncbi:MAG: serine/threonine-protein kinase [Kiritimatiellae bacterium]|nr:serine/threonine-protein kinase [Kiritimatiellia bacterium]MDD5523137.1 serine/threonine-protein kinase [Kiritimatiellia bacterium]
MTTESEQDKRENELDTVVAAFLEAEDRGEKPNPADWVKQYPHLALDLQSFFDDHSNFRRIASARAGNSAAVVDNSKRKGTVKIDLMAHRPPAGPPSSAKGKVNRFGDYELIEEIACGAMGVVYHARQASLNRSVALKMMLGGRFVNRDDVRRFRTEAQAAARLDHPNIVAIYEVGEHEGQQYYTMRLVEGTNLADEMSNLQKDQQAAVRILMNIARAVDFAHQHGVLHRDLKPSNILIDRRGQPQVTDFGLAKCTDDDTSLTISGQVMGTVLYMSPEQAAGKNRNITWASDVYSLGAMLYEMLAGETPFRADNPLDVLDKVRNEDPRSPRKLNPKIDRDLETICLKCLEKNPDRRYSSAEGLARDLEKWLAGEPILARAVKFPERVVKWIRRHPVPTVVVVMSLTLIMTAVLALQWRHDAGRKGDLFDMADTLAQRGNYALARQILEEATKTAKSPKEISKIKSGLKAIDDLEEAVWTMGSGLSKPLSGKKIQQSDDMNGQ